MASSDAVEQLVADFNAFGRNLQKVLSDLRTELDTMKSNGTTNGECQPLPAVPSEKISLGGAEDCGEDSTIAGTDLAVVVTRFFADHEALSLNSTYVPEHERTHEQPKLHNILVEAYHHAALQRGGSSSTTSSVEMVKATDVKLARRRTTHELLMGHRSSVSEHCILHPYSAKLLFWDIVALAILGSDAVMLPLQVAWHFQIDKDIQWVTTGYWVVDLLLTFNKGYYYKANFVRNRRLITRNYVRGWFAIDLIFVLVDLLALITNDQESPLRPFLRVLKVARLSRILKTLKIGQLFKDYCKSKQLVGVRLLWDLMEMLLIFLLFGHWLCCLFFLMGRVAREDGINNWLDHENGRYLNESQAIQYMVSFHWVLGAVVLSPIPPAPQNNTEQFFQLLCTFFAIFVLGAVVSKIGFTVDTIIQQEGGRRGKLRDLSRYLAARAVPGDLAHRVTAYVDNLLKEEALVTSEPDELQFLPMDLRLEIDVRVRGDILGAHPFWALIQNEDYKTFAKLCSKAFRVRTCHKTEVIFSEGSLAKFMRLAVDGTFGVKYTFGMTNGAAQPMSEFKRPQVFSEAALFTAYAHRNSMVGLTLGSLYEVKCDDVLEALASYPTLVAAVYEYGAELLRRIYSGQCGVFAPGSVEIDDVLPMDVIEGAVTSTSLYELAVHVAGNEQLKPWEKLQADLFPGDSEAIERTTIYTFLQQAWSKRSSAAALLAEEVEQLFPELNTQTGTYRRIHSLDERNRALTSMLCILWLLADDYDSFVACQEPRARLTRSTWEELRAIVMAAADPMDQRATHGLLVFLATRGIGKCKTASRMCPPASRNAPEKVLMTLIETCPHILPSVTALGADRELVRTLLRTHERFNLAQFLQGESTPHAVATLQSECESLGRTTVNVYLAALVGVMSGIFGDTTQDGSLFMTEMNGRTMVLAIRSLQNLLDDSVLSLSPVEVYWQYILSRAQQVGFVMDDAESLALGRLVCLTRVLMPPQLLSLLAAWRGLSMVERRVLTAHLLANGIDQRTLVFTFLPKFLANAQGNPCIGLQRALCALVKILGHVGDCLAHCPLETSNITVNLDDFAQFTMDARRASEFEIAVRTMTVDVGLGGCLYLHFDFEFQEHETALLGRQLAVMAHTQERCQDMLERVEAQVAPGAKKKHVLLL